MNTPDKVARYFATEILNNWIDYAIFLRGNERFQHIDFDSSLKVLNGCLSMVRDYPLEQLPAIIQEAQKAFKTVFYDVVKSFCPNNEQDGETFFLLGTNGYKAIIDTCREVLIESEVDFKQKGFIYLTVLGDLVTLFELDLLDKAIIYLLLTEKLNPQMPYNQAIEVLYTEQRERLDNTISPQRNRIKEEVSKIKQVLAVECV